MTVGVYIQGQQLDLFNDEKIEINLQVKDIQDISKIFSDFTQTFSVPSTPRNNAIFEHWYDADIDGTFNANLRVEGHLEVNSIPFRFGTFQLSEAKLDLLKAQSYSITFFSAGVNLSDLFKDDELSSLDLSDFDHEYGSAIVQAMAGAGINADMYYPLISCIGDFDLGPNHSRDLLKSNNDISFREFKPAIRLIKLIEAIETKYSITFSRDFFDRAQFYNLFMWMQREAGLIKSIGDPVTVNITAIGTLATVSASVNTTTDEVIYTGDPSLWSERYYDIRITPASGYSDIDYTVVLYNNGNEVVRKDLRGTKTVLYYGSRIQTNNVKAQVLSQSTFIFAPTVRVVERDINIGAAPTYNSGTATTGGVQTANSKIIASNHTPVIKVKDFFTSLLQMFNLAIVPNSATDFKIDTLDNWYNKGKVFDITPFVDIKTVTVKKPDARKLIDFKYQKPGAVIGEKFLTSNTVAYGDLRAEYAIQGGELKVESKFENLMFERLQNDATGDLSEVHAGYSIDKNLQPYNGAPYIFYRNGYADMPSPHIHIQPSQTLTRIFHTATEDNILPYQVTSSLNFGDEISTYHYTPIEQGLYFNWWKNYVEDLYDQKTRVLSISCEKLPIAILHNLKLNDRFIFRDKKYKISTAKIDLTTGKATFDIFSDLSAPIDSIAETIPLTVDNDNYTIDTTQLTADITEIQTPLQSYVINGINITSYLSTAANEHFEVEVAANTNWTTQEVDTGDGVGWFAVNKSTGIKSDFIRVSVDRNTSAAYREGEIDFIIGGDTFTLTIGQRG
jgi:hypothetical protein